MHAHIANQPTSTQLIDYQNPKNYNKVDQITQIINDDKNIKEYSKDRVKSINEIFDLLKNEVTTKLETKSYDNDNKESLNENEKQNEESEISVSNENITKESIEVLPIQKSFLEEQGFKYGDQIGSGTYAKVKIAYSSKYEKPVAIKIISKTRVPSEYLNRFLPREIEIIRMLRHENLIKYYDSVETTEKVYIIMQLAVNGSLLDLIRKEKQLNDNKARKYFQQLINALEYCHSKGVVHRDIKCENLLFDENMNLRLIDFGFARGGMFPINNSPVLSETYCGSYAYASPEILKGVPYDPHMSDIWASGIVLYSMVYGHLPYDASSCKHLLRQVQVKIIFPRLPANVPIECKKLILKLLAPLNVRIQIKQIKQDKWYSDHL
ncbi:testis-specific serine/threonine-protein kinase 4-like [Condylostylus longicornis]|uniref:testis-specific serine/threonine-protein kinase 4-like n=1 Tax=Condylostylus longicornis TaxID=2530218 RepID=UPI00244DBD93|nr:testis-specific serine/threonine-protein kinase 4-like [Condylostylus longicornis]